MWVEAILSKDNVISLVGDFLPVSIHLGENADDGHYLELFQPREVSLVEGQGLRMSCGARIRWPILGIDLPVTVESVTLLLCPYIAAPPSEDTDAAARDELVFRLTVEAIDFAWAPAVIDHRIAEKINHELAKKHALLSWPFGKSLSHVFELPYFLPPLEAVALKVAWGQVRVTSEAVVIVVSFHSRVLRDHGDHSELASSRQELDPEARAIPTALRARPPSVPQIVAVAGGAALATFAAWVVLEGGARAWRYASGRS
jgi:hypothetical protein